MHAWSPLMSIVTIFTEYILLENFKIFKCHICISKINFKNEVKLIRIYQRKCIFAILYNALSMGLYTYCDCSQCIISNTYFLIR